MKKFKSKLGLELIIPIFGILLFALFNLITAKAWIGIIIISIVLLFILHLVLTTEYIISGENLNVRSGFLINENININSIKKLSETNNIISSPAVSIDRIEILYNKSDVILVSPKDKIEFIESLTEMNKNIEVKLKSKK